MVNTKGLVVLLKGIAMKECDNCLILVIDNHKFSANTDFTEAVLLATSALRADLTDSARAALHVLRQAHRADIEQYRATEVIGTHLSSAITLFCTEYGVKQPRKK